MGQQHAVRGDADLRREPVEPVAGTPAQRAARRRHRHRADPAPGVGQRQLLGHRGRLPVLDEVPSSSSDRHVGKVQRRGDRADEPRQQLVAHDGRVLDRPQPGPEPGQLGERVLGAAVHPPVHRRAQPPVQRLGGDRDERRGDDRGSRCRCRAAGERRRAGRPPRRTARAGTPSGRRRPATAYHHVHVARGRSAAPPPRRPPGAAPSRGSVTVGPSTKPGREQHTAAPTPEQHPLELLALRPRATAASAPPVRHAQQRSDDGQQRGHRGDGRPRDPLELHRVGQTRLRQARRRRRVRRQANEAAAASTDSTRPQRGPPPWRGQPAVREQERHDRRDRDDRRPPRPSCRTRGRPAPPASEGAPRPYSVTPGTRPPAAHRQERPADGKPRPRPGEPAAGQPERERAGDAHQPPVTDPARLGQAGVGEVGGRTDDGGGHRERERRRRRGGGRVRARVHRSRAGPRLSWD